MHIIAKQVYLYPQKHNSQNKSSRKRNHKQGFSQGTGHLQQEQLKPQTLILHTFRVDPVSPGWRGSTVSFLMKLKGLIRKDGMTELTFLRNFLFRLPRKLKKHHTSEQGCWFQRSQWESLLHCWVSTLLLASKSQAASVVSVRVLWEKAARCMLPRRLKKLRPKNYVPIIYSCSDKIQTWAVEVDEVLSFCLQPTWYIWSSSM